MRVLIKIDTLIEMVMKVLMTTSMLVMAIILCVGVFLRVAFHGGITSSSEICNLCILTVTFGCTALVARSDKHVKISYLFDIAKWPIKRIWGMLIDLLMVILAVFLAYYAFQYAGVALTMGRLTSSLRIPVAIADYIVAVGLTLLAIEYFIELVLNIGSKDKIYLGRSPILRSNELEKAE